MTKKQNSGDLASNNFKLRAALDTTFMKLSDDGKIVYQLTLKRGDEVNDAQKVADIIASAQANQFIKVSAEAD